jgi:hypothetical protein
MPKKTAKWGVNKNDRFRKNKIKTKNKKRPSLFRPSPNPGAAFAPRPRPQRPTASWAMGRPYLSGLYGGTMAPWVDLYVQGHSQFGSFNQVSLVQSLPSMQCFAFSASSPSDLARCMYMQRISFHSRPFEPHVPKLPSQHDRPRLCPSEEASIAPGCSPS